MAPQMGTAPIGPLMRKMDRHPNAEVSTPPSRKPTMPPSEPAVAQMAYARSRRRPSRNVEAGMAKAAGAVKAAARPWAARQAARGRGDPEEAAPSEAQVKQALPPTNNRRRP